MKARYSILLACIIACGSACSKAPPHTQVFIEWWEPPSATDCYLHVADTQSVQRILNCFRGLEAQPHGWHSVEAVGVSGTFLVRYPDKSEQIVAVFVWGNRQDAVLYSTTTNIQLEITGNIQLLVNELKPNCSCTHDQYWNIYTNK